MDIKTIVYYVKVGLQSVESECVGLSLQDVAIFTFQKTIDHGDWSYHPSLIKMIPPIEACLQNGVLISETREIATQLLENFKNSGDDLHQ